MAKSSDLKDTILTVAGDLFAENGYAATSIKQIAQAAGCTNAALYYYFEGGKAHILREVVRSYSTDVLSAVDEDRSFEDVSAYLAHLTQRIGETMPRMSKRLSWLVFELPTLPDEEREQFMHHFMGLQRAIRDRLVQYLEEPDQASDLAWVIVCAFLGYGQLFHTLGFEDPSAPSLDQFGEIVMAMVRQKGTAE
jgi:AcrR family transcriptional regulator